MKKTFQKAKSVYFIGIGGIGMSAAAQYFLSLGKKVSGSDLNSSPVTKLLEQKGAKISLNQNSLGFGKNTDLVVYSLAIDSGNPELKETKKRKIPYLSYPEVLGLISKDKYTIAVSGTHGKTTTTAMIAKIMIDAGLSPTVIAGSLMNEYQSNFVFGQSNYFVVEACEYRRSFLNLNPNILVITNIEPEHLDYYRNLKDIQSAFLELARKLSRKDFLISDLHSRNLAPVIQSKDVQCKLVDYQALKVAKLNLKAPGRHNEQNSQAALAVSAVLSIDFEKARQSLENFSGTWRRLEKKGETEKGSLVFDDYAHHPTEIKATLSSLKKLFPGKEIVVVFQPHLYSRTKTMLSKFADALRLFSKVVILPIYAGREKIDSEINSQMLCEEIKKAGTEANFFENFPDASEFLKKSFDYGYIIVTMGAGDIYKLSEILTKKQDESR